MGLSVNVLVGVWVVTIAVEVEVFCSGIIIVTSVGFCLVKHTFWRLTYTSIFSA